MKLTCLQENLNQILSVVAKIASFNKSGLPILNNILLNTENSHLKLTATNLEIAIEAKVRVKIEKEGNITIPAGIFSNYINSLSKETLNLEVKNNELLIRAKNQKAKIKGISVDEFPIIPKLTKKEKVVFKALDLKKALKQTIFAIGDKETRMEISGALFSFFPNSLTIVGTDSYRLVEKTVKIKESNYQGSSLIIPKKTLEEVLRIIKDDEKEEVILYPSENQVLFSYQEVDLLSQIISGDFPNYKEIIPKNFKTKIIFEKEYLLQIIKGASFFTKSGINDLKIKFLPKENKILISSLNNQIGENEAELKVEISGNNNEASFNYQYLLDGLLNLPGEEFSLEIIDNNLPGVIKSTSDDSFLYLIMPIKTNE